MGVGRETICAVEKNAAHPREPPPTRIPMTSLAVAVIIALIVTLSGRKLLPRGKRLFLKWLLLLGYVSKDRWLYLAHKAREEAGEKNADQQRSSSGFAGAHASKRVCVW